MTDRNAITIGAGSKNMFMGWFPVWASNLVGAKGGTNDHADQYESGEQRTMDCVEYLHIASINVFP